MALDIHNFAKQYATAQDRVRNSTGLSEQNKSLILSYKDACLLREVCGTVRLTRALNVLRQAGVLLGKDFDTVERKDVERLLTTLHERGLRPASIATYKAVLKRFLSYVSAPNDFPHTSAPPSVSWLTVHLRKRDEQRLQRKDLLTTSDVAQLLRSCHNTRDKAFVSALWETGARVSELGNLQIKHVTRHTHGYLLDLDGKTGRRTVLVVSSAPSLATWLANHPFATNPESPLWVHYQYSTTPRHVTYGTLRTLLMRLFTRAGIQKPYHPHIFRHSRATHVLARGLMSDAQARQYFGWSGASTMLATYSHLVDNDVHEAVLRENHLHTTTPVADELAPRVCQRCTALNKPGSRYCTTCTGILDEQQAHEDHEQHQRTDALLRQLCEVLVKRGLLDEAATAVHEAALGETLAQLAKQHPPPRPTSTR